MDDVIRFTNKYHDIITDNYEIPKVSEYLRIIPELRTRDMLVANVPWTKEFYSVMIEAVSHWMDGMNHDLGIIKELMRISPPDTSTPEKESEKQMRTSPRRITKEERLAKKKQSVQAYYNEKMSRKKQHAIAAPTHTKNKKNKK